MLPITGELMYFCKEYVTLTRSIWGHIKWVIGPTLIYSIVMENWFKPYMDLTLCEGELIKAQVRHFNGDWATMCTMNN